MFGRCRDCAFFKRVSPRDPDGFCHRYAPTPGVVVLHWPAVNANEGCGDFEATDVAKPSADKDPLVVKA